MQPARPSRASARSRPAAPPLANGTLPDPPEEDVEPLDRAAQASVSAQDHDAVAPSQLRQRQRTATRRSVQLVLDELAPQRSPGRNERPTGAVEAYRTGYGCVLQGPEAALSVSWYADESASDDKGELHVRAWRGVVSRRGRGSRSGATIAAEVVLRSVPSSSADCAWVASDGTAYDAGAVVLLCRAMLAQQGVPDE